MTLYDHLNAYLRQATGLSSVVGKLYRSDIHPEAEPPLIRYAITAVERDYTHDGPGDVAVHTVVFDAWGQSYEAARALSVALAAALHLFPGVREVTGGADIYDSDTRVYGVEMEASIAYQES